MYNEDRKSRFISEYTNSVAVRHISVRVFEAISKYEEDIGKDISAMTKEELQPIIDETLGVMSQSKGTIMTMLREYAKWCVDHDMPGAGMAILDVNLLGLDKLRRQTVSSPFHLQTILNSAFTPENEQQMDNVYRAYCWIAFAGISKKQAVQITADDLDFESMTIRSNGLEYPIYREAVPAFRNVARLTEFKYFHPLYNSIISRKRVDGPSILRGVKRPPRIETLDLKTFDLIAAARAAGKTDSEISYNRLVSSGILYRGYESERAGIPPRFKEYAIKTIRAERPDMSPERLKANAVVAARSYTENYKRWKLAHGQ